eukprot:gnl/TRDRNA2_/TRDRNA2_159737_c0_seq1.p1 gnl/TRDRNA2_/TRDRNA2_159737_c0~~gnl/TRDRNA2_/TRDRNA2_159737_c0_seq1.p1  ORF type:complete len:206 (-),score=20.10 gnl/TRDRNA2_/TRDRNA2_159737_c0_seq1:61-624(-)
MLHGMRKLLGSGFVDYPKEEYMYSPPANRSLLKHFRSWTRCPHGYGSASSGGGCWNVFQGRPVVAATGESTPLYGLGYSYAHRLPDEDNARMRSAAAVRRGVEKQRFDVVVFGGAIAGEPCAHSPTRLPVRECPRLWDLTQRYYPRDRILVFDSSDGPWGNEDARARIRQLATQAHYFAVNMPDECP